jgi:hypothetical protein
MKMVKKTLIAMALVAFLASTAPAAIEVYYFGPMSGGPNDKESGVKSDGEQKVYWPYEWKELRICAISLRMNIGMYVDVKDCKDRKIILDQVECGDIDQPDNEFPCYYGCTNIDVRANFDVKLNTELEESSGIIDKWDDHFPDGDVVAGDGNYHTVKVCIKTWRTRLYKSNGTFGTEKTIGTVYLTAKPDMAPAWSVYEEYP